MQLSYDQIVEVDMCQAGDETDEHLQGMPIPQDGFRLIMFRYEARS